MTCIIGVEHEGKVYMGADSMSTDGYNKDATRLRKVFRVGEFLIAYTGSFRMGQILQYHLEVRHQQDGETDERYMVVAFVEAVRRCLKEHGYSRIDSNQEEGGSFLVGYRDRLYSVYSDFQINSSTTGVAALGAGQDYALGALMALEFMPPVERIQRALQISARLSCAVFEPFIVEQLN